jgi:hypothetical protein
MGNRRLPIGRHQPRSQKAGHHPKGITRPISERNLTFAYELEAWWLAGCRHDQQQALSRWRDSRRIKRSNRLSATFAESRPEVPRFSLGAIGVNRMRQENTDARQNKNSRCNIHHRTGPKAHPTLQICIVRFVGDRPRHFAHRFPRFRFWPQTAQYRPSPDRQTAVLETENPNNFIQSSTRHNAPMRITKPLLYR